MLSCFVWTRVLWVFLLAACSCLVLCWLMAGDLFYWPRACVVMFVVSTWHVFPCAMCAPVDCLALPILFPDYWFICPTCPPFLRTLFALPIYSPCVCSLVHSWMYTVFWSRVQGPLCTWVLALFSTTIHDKYASVLNSTT